MGLQVGKFVHLFATCRDDVACDCREGKRLSCRHRELFMRVHGDFFDMFSAVVNGEPLTLQRAPPLLTAIRPATAGAETFEIFTLDDAHRRILSVAKGGGASPINGKRTVVSWSPDHGWSCQLCGSGWQGWNACVHRRRGRAHVSVGMDDEELAAFGLDERMANNAGPAGADESEPYRCSATRASLL